MSSQYSLLPVLRLYFENPVGRVLEHPDGYAVVRFHNGARNLQHFQALMEHTWQLLQRHSWHKLLGDQRIMAPFTTEESRWLLTAGQLMASKGATGLFGAVILPHDVFARLSVSKAMENATVSDLTYRVFDNEPAAEAWLNAQA
jgi:hypothetical protein